MSAWGALGAGKRGLILGAAALALAGLGYLGWQGGGPVDDPVPVAAQDPAPPAPAPAEPVAATPEPEAAPAVAPPAEAAAELQPDLPPPDLPPPDLPPPDLPKIDVWRVAADGEALVSGLALPGVSVAVVVDGTRVAEGAASGSGEFALLFTLAPNPNPSLMWLAMIGPDGAEVLSQDRVALGPIRGPVLAEVAPAEPAAPTPVPDVAQPDPAPDPAPEPAPEPPVALLLSDDGALVLQGEPVAAPAETAQVMIDTIAYTPEGEVQIGGRGGAGLTLRIYLDNTPKLDLRVAATGQWLTTLPDTAPGIYTLRVDQLDDAGAVLSRFETPFKRETLEALALATVRAGASAALPPVPEDLAPEAPLDTPPAPQAEVASEPLPEPALDPEPASEPVAEPVPEIAADPVPEPAPPPPPPPPPLPRPRPPSTNPPRCQRLCSPTPRHNRCRSPCSRALPCGALRRIAMATG